MNITFKEFLLEKRKTPELNIKLTPLEQLENIKNQYGERNIYVRFVSIPKLGHNISYGHETPIGIYAYPLSYVLGMQMAVPYQSESRYIVVFKVLDDANLWDVTKNDIGEIKPKLLKAITKFISPHTLASLYPPSKDITTSKQLWDYMYTCIKTDLYTSKQENKVRNKKERSIMARNILVSIGIDGVTENTSGFDVIHENEPVQSVFFNVSKLKQIDLIDTQLNKINKITDKSNNL